MKILVERLNRAFRLTGDMAESLPGDAFGLKLEDLPSNTIGEQFWCMTGARESYLKAIINKGWSGFSCSLDDTASRDKVMQCLQRSGAECMDFLSQHELNDVQAELLVTLLEHEIQHHGQLIRYVYGNKLAFPESWKERYTV